MQHGDERGVVGVQRRAARLCGDAARAAQQEDVVGRLAGAFQRGVPAPHGEHVDAIVGRAAVKHIDDVVTIRTERSGGVDHHGVAARLAVDGQRVAAGRRRVSLQVGHRLQRVDDEEVFAIAQGRKGPPAARRIAAVGARLAAAVAGDRATLRHRLACAAKQQGVCGNSEEGLVEVDLVDIVVAEDARQVAGCGGAVADHARQVHDRAELRRVVRCGNVNAIATEVAEDVDVVPCQDLRVRIGVDVVADPQHHGALRGVHESVTDGFGCVLNEQCGARREQVQVLALHVALAHGEAHVTRQCLQQHHPSRLVDLGEIDVVRRAGCYRARRVVL